VAQKQNRPGRGGGSFLFIHSDSLRRLFAVRSRFHYNSSLALNLFIAPIPGWERAQRCLVASPHIGSHKYVLAWPITDQGFDIAIGTQQPGNICPTKNSLFVLPAILTLLFHRFSPFISVLPAEVGLPGRWTGPKGAIGSNQNLNNRKGFSTPAPHHLLFRQVIPTLQPVPVGWLMMLRRSKQRG
jgi:hypothetical protein